MRTVLLFTAGALLGPGLGAAQAVSGPDTAKRDPTNKLPLVTTRTVQFTTDEGTAMSVDVSPDGQTIVFDLLGDIYTIPISGGRAVRLIGGTSIDAGPRFSPDGQSLVFLSDRGGTEGIWIADRSGAKPRQLIGVRGTRPIWTPDGKFVVVGGRMYDRRGGSGVPLTQTNFASFGHDGRYMWYESWGPQAARYDRQTGESETFTKGPGGAYRPIISPDGKTLVFTTKNDDRSGLVALDLATGKQTSLATGDQDARADRNPNLAALPASAWLPDGSAIVTARDGKLWRVEIATNRWTNIPFTVDVELSLGPASTATARIADSVSARQIRQPVVSPNGRRVSFVALDKIWVMDLPNGPPRRLTSAKGVTEHSPTWSPDGRYLAFARWSDGNGGGGDILRVRVDESGFGAEENLTRAPAVYLRLMYTADGSRLVFVRGPRRGRVTVTEQGVGPTAVNLELRSMIATGGEQQVISRLSDTGDIPVTTYPHRGPEPDRVYYTDRDGLVSIRLDGTERKVILKGSTPATTISPDGRRIASVAGNRNQLYLFDLPMAGEALQIDPSMEANASVPARRISIDGATLPTWSATGDQLTWALGSAIYRYDVDRGEAAVTDSTARAAAGKTDSIADRAGAPSRIDVTIRVPSDRPTGSIVLRGARLITMNGSQIIERGDLVVTNDRITAIGPTGAVAVPIGATVIDVSGKTIIPGYIDLHSHLAPPWQIHRSQIPQFVASLGYGVTTVHDPHAAGSDGFIYADRAATGEILGPRFVERGPMLCLDAAKAQSAGQAKEVLEGCLRGDFSGRAGEPDRPSRISRQYLVQAARDLGILVGASGNGDYLSSLGAVLDGYGMHDDIVEATPIRRDFATLAAAAGIVYAPGLVTATNAPAANFLYETLDLHEDAKLRRLFHHPDLDRRTRARRLWVRPDLYRWEQLADAAARVVQAGGRVGLATRGELPGLAAHWEIWLLATGGLGAHEALRAATITGAEALGLAAELGSLEVGKYADLQILDLDPLADIHNTTSIRHVMKNGRLYQADTMAEVYPDRRPAEPFWWTDLDPSSVKEQR